MLDEITFLAEVMIKTNTDQGIIYHQQKRMHHLHHMQQFSSRSTDNYVHKVPIYLCCITKKIITIEDVFDARYMHVSTGVCHNNATRSSAVAKKLQCLYCLELMLLMNIYKKLPNCHFTNVYTAL